MEWSGHGYPVGPRGEASRRYRAADPPGLPMDRTAIYRCGAGHPADRRRQQCHQYPAHPPVRYRRDVFVGDICLPNRDARDGRRAHTGYMVISERYVDCLKHEFMHVLGFDSHWRPAGRTNIRSRAGAPRYRNAHRRFLELGYPGDPIAVQPAYPCRHAARPQPGDRERSNPAWPAAGSHCPRRTVFGRQIGKDFSARRCGINGWRRGHDIRIPLAASGRSPYRPKRDVRGAAISDSCRRAPPENPNLRRNARDRLGL